MFDIELTVHIVQPNASRLHPLLLQLYVVSRHKGSRATIGNISCQTFSGESAKRCLKTLNEYILPAMTLEYVLQRHNLQKMWEKGTFPAGM